MPNSLVRTNRLTIAALAAASIAAFLTVRTAAGQTVCDTGGTPEPSPSSSSSPTPEPSPTISPPPIGLSAASHERASAPAGEDAGGATGTCDASVALTAGPASGVWGTTFLLSGSLSCNGNLLGAKDVTLKKLAAGAWTAVATTQTSDDGTGYQFTQKPSHTTTYKVFFPGDSLCAAAASAPLTVIVRPGVAFNAASGGSSARGGMAVFSGSVLPAHTGHRVILQVLQGGAWRNATWSRLDSSSRYRLTYTRTSGSGPLLFRIAYPTQHGDHGWNVSRNIKVTWT